MFIKNYFQIATHFMRLTCKDKLDCSQEAKKAFQTLKKVFTTTPILTHSNFSNAFFMEIDDLDFALEAILSQPRKSKKLHDVAFVSKKFNAIEINYTIHSEELFAIVDSFQE